MTAKTNLTVCENCEFTFEVETPLVEQMPAGVEHVYLECPACYEKYTCYYTDPKVRELQKKLRGQSAGLKGARGKVHERKVKALMKTQQRLGKRMDMLSARYSNR